LRGNSSLESPKTSLPQELKWFLFISAVLWVISIIYLAVQIRFGSGRHHGLPEVFSTPPFSDLKAVIPKLGMVHQPEFFTVDYRWIYPAPSVFLYMFLLLFSHYPHIYAASFYCLVVLSGLFVLVWNTVAALNRRGLARKKSWLMMIGATLLSWPIFFALKTGNTEGVIWIGVAIAIWAYYRRMWWTSAILIGIVAGFKIYPILLLGLFLRERKYLQILASLSVFVAFTAGSLAYIGPTIPIAYRNVANGIKSFTDLGFYPGAIDRNYLTFDHSLVSLFRILTTAHPEYMSIMSQYYMPVAGLVMTVLFFARAWKLPRLNQLFFIIVAIVLLPPKSYDYTLQMLYIPWAWLTILCVTAARRGERIQGAMPVMICLAFICSPEFFIKFGGYYSYGQFKTLCLLVLLYFLGRYRFAENGPLLISQPA
jgi:Glycosyltransferase family 87